MLIGELEALVALQQVECGGSAPGGASPGEGTRPVRAKKTNKRWLLDDDSTESGEWRLPPTPRSADTPVPQPVRKIRKSCAAGGSPASPSPSLSPSSKRPPTTPQRARVLTDAEAAHKVLTALRDTYNPAGDEFMAVVDSIFSAAPRSSPHSKAMTALLASHGARSKYILRKLAFSLVPNSKEQRVAYIRHTLRLPDVRTEENQVTKQEAYRIIRAAYELDPDGIRIPQLHSRQQTAMAMFTKDVR